MAINVCICIESGPYVSPVIQAVPGFPVPAANPRREVLSK